MEDRPMKKKVKSEDKDRISKLSDDIIHQIMFFLDTRLAVQTSILSKRWKLVWTTLPFLNFSGYNKHYMKDLNKYIDSKFIEYVLLHRSHQCKILKLDLCPIHGLTLRQTKKFVKYAINHKVERLNVQSADHYCSLNLFTSTWLKELKLTMKFGSDELMEFDCWTLPNLTALHVNRTHYGHNKIRKFPESLLIGLPALTTLCLNHIRLPDFMSLPSLTTLCLKSCSWPKKVWDFPALSTLELVNVLVFPKNMSEYFLALVSLRNLTIDFGFWYIGCCYISSSRLLNLKIRTSLETASYVKIVLWAPKLCNFNSTGFFWTTIEGSELENVNIKFWNCTMYNNKARLQMLKPGLFKIMFSQLSSTKILTLDLLTLQALSEISDVLVDLDSPFYNLKYMMLPRGCKESNVSSSVRRYLLGGSPNATFVETLSRDDVYPQMDPALSIIARDVALEEPLVTPTKELIN